jgi:hypothetical protein
MAASEGIASWPTSKANHAVSTPCFQRTLDELIPQDHVCRVIEAFVGRLDMNQILAIVELY